MSQYLAAILAAPILMRQLRARAIRDALLALAAAAGVYIITALGGQHTWPGALIGFALLLALVGLLWDAYDCLRIRHDLRKKYDA